MSSKKNQTPLGILLRNADLISNEQLQNALEVQSQFNQMKLGEILVLQEGLRAKTIDFFVEQWQELIAQGQQFPIGYYLENAALLNEQQINIILQEQQSNSQKFGVLAAQKGWVKQSTINFLLDNLSQSPQQMSLSYLEKYNDQSLHLEKKYADSSLLLSRILAWTGGNGILTRTICQVFANSDFNIPAGSEINAVDQFVEGSLIRKWQTSEAAEHIRYLKQNLVNSSNCEPSLLLQVYREILLSGNQPYRETPEQNELLQLGLVVREENYVRVANLIFQQVFNQEFIAQKLSQQQAISTTITPLKTELKATNITEYTPTASNQKPIDEIEIPQVLEPSIIEDNTTTYETRESNTPEPLTKIGSLVTLAAIALFIPLVLAINNYYSSLLEPQQKSKIILDSLSKAEELQQFCNQLDLADLSSSLSLISKLEKEKQALLQDRNDSSAVFPDDCEVALNRYRVLVAPLLGKQNRILEAIRNLCKVPEDSEMYLDAEVWLKRWYDSANWGEETKFYLEEFAEYNNSSCPASHFTEYES
ncbi:MAG: hypothetical protein AAF298_12440 [Cyanobacteria bacterium P01_A01_bin.40]